MARVSSSDLPPPYVETHASRQGYGTLPSDDEPDLFGYVPRSRVLHAFYIEEEAVKVNCVQVCVMGTCMLPILGFCCAWWGHYRARQSARASVLVITEDEVVAHVRPHRQCCWCTGFCIASTNTKTVPLDIVSDVRVVTPPCSGHRTLYVETYNGAVNVQTGERRPEISMFYLRDPDMVRTAILDARDQLQARRSNMAAVPTTVNIVNAPIEQQPTPVAPLAPSENRCRLTVATEKDAKRYVAIVDLNGSWKDILFKCATKVGLDPDLPIVLSLANGAELSDPSELSHDDFLIVTVQV